MADGASVYAVANELLTGTRTIYAPRAPMAARPHSAAVTVNGHLGPPAVRLRFNYPAVQWAFWATARGLELQENPRVKRLTTSGGLG